MGEYLACFKAYDVRGKVPDELNADIAYRIGRAYADETKARKVCVGHDIRNSGPMIVNAVTTGLIDSGVDVVDIGMVGTEMVYFSTANFGYDGGIMVTASHNPPEYNVLKMVRAESRPLSGDSGLLAIERRTHEQKSERSGTGILEVRDIYTDYVERLMELVPPESLKPLHILADAGNGAAGVALTALVPRLPLKVAARHWEPNGNFPNGVPNPILEASRVGTIDTLKKGDYAFGAAWDGDYDRCFFFDAHGNFIEGYYLVGLLAQAMLHDSPGATIVYDPRLTWNTLDIVSRAGGKAVICKSGHAFIKEKMRAVDAIYGGEMSAHHYFKSNWYCDSGMLPFLLVAKLISQTGRGLHELVGDMMERFPCSGEINSTVADVPAVLAKVESYFGGKGKVDKLDGLSVEFDDWRFNLRGSNTEPVIRLNVEARGDRALLDQKTAEILQMIRL